MIEIGAFEAKTHFSELLRRVEAGEEFRITRRGKTVAVLTPTPAQQTKKKKAKEAFARLREFGKKHPLNATIEEIIAWKNEGRK